MLLESRHLRMLLKSVALSAGVKRTERFCEEHEVFFAIEETSGALAVKSSYNLGEEDQPFYEGSAPF